MPVDERIKQFVHLQVADGIHNVAEVIRHSELFVKQQLFKGKQLPSLLNRKYYPHRRDFENLIYRSRIASMRSVVDQENLQAKITDWESADVKIYFRPLVSSQVERVSTDDLDNVVLKSDKNGLLFIHQTDWQRRLLSKYGCMCLLDATYKTTKYAVPLFFLCVRTNVDYIVVATFVTQYEDCSSIQEALQIIKSWNTEWKPDSFMVDFCEAEINGIQSVFTGTKTSLSMCFALLI